MTRPADCVTLALTFADDSVGIMSFVTREYYPDGTVRWSRLAEPGTIEAELARTAQALAPEKVPIRLWRPIGVGEIPTDRTYRNALRDDGKTLAHDVEAVKVIAVERLRQDRAPLLADLDRQWMRATGQKDAATADAIEAQRQTLRDLPAVATAALATAKTVAEVQAALPLAADVVALTKSKPGVVPLGG